MTARMLQVWTTQDTLPETVVSINFHFLPLAVEMAVATLSPGTSMPGRLLTGRGRVNHVDVEAAQEEPTIVMGTLLVNSVPATVLFDSGASHSFISGTFAFMHGITYEDMQTPLVVSTPGSHCHATMISYDVPLIIEGLVFRTSPIVLQSSNIDLILGMDWLKTHNALIDCAAKTVQLAHSSGQTINYSTRTIPNAEVQIYALNALNASPLDGIENIPVVRDFQDVFPEELPGMPPV